MRPPKKVCGDTERWRRAIQAILQELGNKSPKELILIFDPDHNSKADDLNKIRRQELFASYMTDALGIEFKYTTPTDKYPMFYVMIVIGLKDARVTLEIFLPRSVAEYIRHEGALRENSKRKFELTNAEARQFMAVCIVQGLDPQEEWARIKRDVLGSGILPGELSGYEGRLHELGLYRDELTITTEEEHEDD
ncbi:MAG: hypothetical protein QG675_579 [Patescibacteria group bacterium]|jgi:hypothetical protein|nr:hypothetical protein [Patescibacteria group bacterium]